jgi:hypothetical protein
MAHQAVLVPAIAGTSTGRFTVKVPSRPINDLDNEYQLKLLELALNHAGQPYKLERVDLNLNQYSLQQALAKGKVINVFWMGTSSALESPSPQCQSRCFVAWKGCASPSFTPMPRSGSTRSTPWQTSRN